MTCPAPTLTWGMILNQGIFGYLVFVLTSSSISMFLAAGHMRTTIRAYLMSLSYFAAAVVIYINTPLTLPVALFAMAISLIGPFFYQRFKARVLESRKTETKNTQL